MYRAQLIAAYVPPLICHAGHRTGVSDKDQPSLLNHLVDLPRGVKSGLIVAEEVLKDINGISFIFLEQSDVVRHPLVGRIIQAYEKSKEKAVQ